MCCVLTKFPRVILILYEEDKDQGRSMSENEEMKLAKLGEPRQRRAGGRDSAV